MTKGIRKLSKRKQRLYEKLLKNRIPKNEIRYKGYKYFYETNANLKNITIQNKS